MGFTAVYQSCFPSYSFNLFQDHTSYTDENVYIYIQLYQTGRNIQIIIFQKSLTNCLRLNPDIFIPPLLFSNTTCKKILTRLLLTVYKYRN